MGRSGQLFYGHAGKKGRSAYGLRAERTYRTVSVSQKKTHKSADALHGADAEIRLSAPGKYVLDGGKREVCLKIFPVEKNLQIPKKMYTKWFDCDKIKGTPVVRTRQTGDYIMLDKDRKKSASPLYDR